MMKRIWKDVLDQDISTSFPRMTYQEAMERFGTDKPDIRFGLELQNISSLFEKSEFQVFQNALPSGSIRCIRAEGQASNFSRKSLDELQEVAKRYGAKGLLWIKVNAGGELQSPAAKFFKPNETEALKKALSLKEGDLVLAVADENDQTVCLSMGAIRLAMGDKMGVIPKLGSTPPAFLWIHRFPLLEFNPEEQRFFAMHHPFTMPVDDQVEDLLEGRNLDQLHAAAYDLVLNGAELGSGSLRIYRQDIQDAMFKALGMSSQDVKEMFGFFIEALQYGTPPHAGLALGVERLVAMPCE